MSREAEETIIARMVVDEQDPSAKQTAKLLGPAPGMEDVVGQEERDMWNKRDQSVTPQQALQLYTEAKDNGLSDQDAEGIVTLKVFPNRGPMLLAVSDDPKEQARYARKMRGQPPIVDQGFSAADSYRQPQAIETTATDITAEPKPEAGGY